MHKKPITGKPNIKDDDTINRGISGQCLCDTGMYYDPATGKPTGGGKTDMNLVHNPGKSEVPDGY